MKKCKNCENDIPNRNSFCNNLCQNEYQNNEKIKKWLNGENFLRSNGLIIPQWIRNYLLLESDFKCSNCGWGEKNIYSDKIPLEVDHIDGDAKNNLKENLRILCPNCHSLTKTYKNIGNRVSSRINRK
jgi:rubredoxin